MKSAFKIGASLLFGVVIGISLVVLVVCKSWQEHDWSKINAPELETILATSAIHVVAGRGKIEGKFYVNNADERLQPMEGFELPGNKSTENILKLVQSKTNNYEIRPWSERPKEEPCEVLPGCPNNENYPNNDNYVAVSVEFQPFEWLAIVRYSTLACGGKIVLLKWLNDWHVIDDGWWCA